MSWKEKIYSKAKDFIKEVKGIRKPVINDLFERLLYISPEDLVVTNYLRKRPFSAFNPGAILNQGELEIFPRLIFDYYWYVSSIGYFKIKIEELVKKEFETKIIIWPGEKWELGKGVEDARVIKKGDEYHALHTSVSRRDGEILPLQGYTKLNSSLEILEKKYLRIFKDDEEIMPKSMKDSAFLEISHKEASLLIRPNIENIEICWRSKLLLEEGIIPADSMEPVLAFEKFEIKVGWSTNAIGISNDEYLIGWHGISREDLMYRNGFAILSKEGELLGITDYVLSPKGVIEMYGDRPGVIFGCGLVLSKEFVYWIGGISDYAIGIFRTTLDKILENVRWIKKR